MVDTDNLQKLQDAWNNAVNQTPTQAPQGQRALQDALTRSRYNNIPDRTGIMNQALEPGRDATTPVLNNRPDKLSKRDLLQPENMRVIRRYMTDRYGAEMVNRYTSDQDLMERYVDSLRFFNGNVVGTIGEATWVADASEESKAAAADAYDLFDRLGNVFVVDGVGGALDGVKDYVFAAARDPSSWLGLFTGGAAKAAVLGSQTATKEALRRAATEAGKRFAAQGFSQEAQEEAAKRAMQKALADIGQRRITEKGRERLLGVAADNVRNGIDDINRYIPKDGSPVKGTVAEKARARYLAGLELQGEEDYLAQIAARGDRAALGGSFVGDALAAFGQDIAVQNTLMEVGSQEKYSAAQTALGTFFGGILAPGMKVVGDAAQKLTGRQSRRLEVQQGKLQTEIDELVETALDKDETKKVYDEFINAAKTWQQKVEDGLEEQGGLTIGAPAGFWRDVIFGSEDGDIKGVLSVYKDKGLRPPSQIRISDLLGNLLADLEPDQVNAISNELKGLGIQLGDGTKFSAVTLGDLYSASVSQAGALLNVSSQASKYLDYGVIRATKAMDDEAEELVAEAGGEQQVFAYGQSLWRRLLVSNPATSMVNIAGFGMYFGSQGIAEVLSMAQMYGMGVVKSALGGNGQDMFRRARHYREMIGQKLSNFLDPHTTRQNFEVILDEFDGAKQILLNNVTGGIDVAATKYNLDPNSGVVKVTEAIANQSAKATLVMAQDAVTKSQMFMAELDKAVRMRYNRSLDDIMASGDIKMIDNEMVNDSMNMTMQSVFSRNYTIKGSAPAALRKTADLVESVSNTPFIGQVLPFGRFFNNVIASMWRFGPGGYMDSISGMMRDGVTTNHLEAFNRSAFASAFFGAAMLYDRQRKEEGLGMFQIRVGDTIINAENSFPLSLFLVGGRLLNDDLSGEGTTGAQWQKLGEQAMVGQLASDIEYGSTLRSFYNTLTTQDMDTRRKFAIGAGKAAGGFLAGFTRPLDVLNKTIGAVTGTDYAKDPRLADGLTNSALMASTKYIDNIAEGLDKLVDQQTPGEVPGITGERLRTATRRGDVRNPNFGLALLGIRQEPNRTAAESVLDAVDLPRYMENIRTANPRFDRLANIYLADLLEVRLRELQRSTRFNRLTAQEKRAEIKGQIKDAKEEMRKLMGDRTYTPENVFVEYERKKAMEKPRVKREFALKLMSQNGSKAEISDMNLAELEQFNFYVSNYDEIMEYR